MLTELIELVSPIRRLKKRLEPVLNTKLRKFQLKGIRFLEKRNGRVLLGDDMGLGKTIQVLGFLALKEKRRLPAVIVCPANGKYTWYNQIKEHTKNLKSEILHGRTPYKTKENILIINYDILPAWESYLSKLKIKTLVIDECHYVKTRKIKRTKSCQMLAKNIKHVIALSGTPIINRPVEFFPILNMLFPKQFSSFWKFAFRYCSPRKGYGGAWEFKGSSNYKELHRIIKNFMIRRMKVDVLKELPVKQRIPIYVELDNRREYEIAKADFLEWYKREYGSEREKKVKNAENLVKIGQLKLLSAKGKLKAAKQFIDDFLEENPNQKLVVFCYHRVIFSFLQEHYKDIVAVGGKGSTKREDEVQKFQKNPKYRIFLGSLKADKEVITLTAASNVFFIELGWTSGEHEQAEDRVNRIGQESNSINAYYLLAKNSIDEHIWDILENKRRTISLILDGKEHISIINKRIGFHTLVTKLQGPKE